MAYRHRTPKENTPADCSDRKDNEECVVYNYVMIFSWFIFSCVWAEKGLHLLAVWKAIIFDFFSVSLVGGITESRYFEL